MGLFDFFRKGSNEGKRTAGIERNTDSFKCPYCFEELRHDQVHFLIKDAGYVDQYSEEELSFMEDEQRVEIEKKQSQVKPYLPRAVDELLDSFWNEVGGREAYSARIYPDNEITWNSPLVTPSNAGLMTENGYEKDKDGFVISVTDKYSHHKSEVRICPHCHNPLPKLYGKYPVFSISVVGVKMSGKTVYLTQLISDLQKYLGEVGLDKYVTDDEADTFKKIDTQNSFIAPPTTVETIMPPITVVTKRGGQLNTLVFYDISGENCVDPNRMSKYGKYISNSDGVIMMIDPNQFRQIAAQNGRDKQYDVSAVLNVMKESFLVDKQDASGKVNLPVAFVLSKSDYLVGNLARNPKWAHSLITKEVSTKQKKVNYSEIIQVRKNVRDIIREYAPESYLTDTVDQNFSNFVFLAVSALGCETRNVFANPNNPVKGNYSFDRNTYKRADILRLELSSEEERRMDAYIQNYDFVREADKTEYLSYNQESGFRFNLPMLSADLYETRDTIQFRFEPEKRAVYEVYPIKDKSGTVKWETGSRFSIQELPKHTPQPKRIEEPLHWLLTEFGLAEKA